MTNVIVIGAGVSGLSSAIRLLENGFTVHIISREDTLDTTSVVAGAIWSGHHEAAQNLERARVSLDVFRRMAGNPETGVVIAHFRDIYPRSVSPPWCKDELDSCVRIPVEDLPDGYVDGYLMEIPLIQTTTYMPYLLRRFIGLGGTIEYRNLDAFDELVGTVPLIINCSGVWSRFLANDERTYPIWGQVVLVEAPQITELLMDDDAFTYIFPRKDGCVLGGVAIPDRWEREVDDDITDDILSRCARFFPEVRNANILDKKVGLRPGRDEVRLEAERLNDETTIIHNYGHGPIGFTLSWGCADEVLTLAKALGTD